MSITELSDIRAELKKSTKTVKIFQLTFGEKSFNNLDLSNLNINQRSKKVLNQLLIFVIKVELLISISLKYLKWVGSQHFITLLRLKEWDILMKSFMEKM